MKSMSRVWYVGLLFCVLFRFEDKKFKKRIKSTRTRRKNNVKLDCINVNLWLANFSLFFFLFPLVFEMKCCNYNFFKIIGLDEDCEALS